MSVSSEDIIALSEARRLLKEAKEKDEVADLKEAVKKAEILLGLLPMGSQERMKASIFVYQSRFEMAERKEKRALEIPQLDEALRSLLGISREDVFQCYSSNECQKTKCEQLEEWVRVLANDDKASSASDPERIALLIAFISAVHKKVLNSFLIKQSQMALEHIQEHDKSMETALRNLLSSGTSRRDALASLKCQITECGNSCFLCREILKDSAEMFREAAKKSAQEQEKRLNQEKLRKERDREQRERFWQARRLELEARKKNEKEKAKEKEKEKEPTHENLLELSPTVDQSKVQETPTSILATCPPSTCTRNHPTFGHSIASNQDHALVFCSQGCRIHFHLSCWSSLRPSLVCPETPSKMFRCPTPDCHGLVSRITTNRGGGREIQEKEFRIPTLISNSVTTIPPVQPQPQPQPQPPRPSKIDQKPAGKPQENSSTAEVSVVGSGSSSDEGKEESETVRNAEQIQSQENIKNENEDTSTTPLKVLAFGQMKQTEEKHFLETMAESLPSSLSPPTPLEENLKIDFDKSSVEHEGRIVELENGIGHIFCEKFPQVKLYFVLPGARDFCIPQKPVAAPIEIPAIEKQQSVETIPPRVIKFCYPSAAPATQPLFPMPEKLSEYHMNSQFSRDSSQEQEEPIAIENKEEREKEGLEVGDSVCFLVTKSFDQKGFFAHEVRRKKKDEKSGIEATAAGASAESGGGVDGEKRGSNKRRTKKKGKENQEQKEIKEMLMGKFK